jgi:hypothetical protein
LGKSHQFLSIFDALSFLLRNSSNVPAGTVDVSRKILVEFAGIISCCWLKTRDPAGHAKAIGCRHAAKGKSCYKAEGRFSLVAKRYWLLLEGLFWIRVPASARSRAGTVGTEKEGKANRWKLFHREEHPTLERHIIDASERALANYRYVIGQHFGV